MLTEQHRQYLSASAIIPAVAQVHGVRSETSEPRGILFPYTNPSGRVVDVFRPDNPGDGPKYRSPAGEYPGLNLIHEEGDGILLVEGTKQALAVACWSSPGYAVAGMNGCWGWRRRDKETGESLVIPDLDIVQDRHVVIALDADYDTNPDVHAAGNALARACWERKAKSVRLMRHSGQGKEGLDDVLARLPVSKRGRHLTTWISDSVPLEGEETKPSPYVDLRALLSEEAPEDPWLLEDVLVQGFGHVVYAPFSKQKSLFLLWACIDVIRSRDDVHVLYLDYEMNRNLLRDRLESMGFTADSPETDLIQERLHYWLIPDLAPLDTVEGGKELEARVKELDADYRNLLVVIDTTIRSVQGGENDSSTIGDFSRFTAKHLNKMEVTWVRVDHAGKDVKRGQRGTSAKGDDVSIIWQVHKTGEGIDLKNEKDRAGYIQGEKVSFRRFDNPLRFEQVEQILPPGTNELVLKMDEAGLPDDVSRNVAKASIKASAGTTVWAAAIKIRKAREHQWESD